MNEIVNKFLLVGDKFMPENLPTVLANHLLKRMNTKFIKKQQIKEKIYQNEPDEACFQHNIAYAGLRICLEEWLLLKYYVIKHVIFLKIQNIDIIVDLIQWFLNFLI